MSVQRRTPDRRRGRASGGRTRSRVLRAVMCLVLAGGVFMQVTMLARISSQSKNAAALEGEIEELSANAENLELCINRFHNLDNIAERAAQLGMEIPSEAQIRVVHVARSESMDATAQAAGYAGTEGTQSIQN